jgi:Na+-transporting NADH:ubiquinone oxidoreductase subunit A
LKQVLKFFQGLLLTTFISQPLFAQGAGEAASDGSRLVLVAIISLVLALVFAVIVVTADNLIRIKGRQIGFDEEKNGSLNLFPSLTDLFRGSRPGYAKQHPFFDLRSGHDILLEGQVTDSAVHDAQVNTFSVQPTDFHGIAPIPKMLVETGQEVKAGDSLFFDKSNPDIMFAAPVSGEVVAINRGEKRAITEVVILADKDGISYREFPSIDLSNTTREALQAHLMGSGVWPMIRQRPYLVLADPNRVPRDIFISTFDTAPLAPDAAVLVKGREDAFQKGLDALALLTDGHIYLGLDGRGEEPPSQAYTEAQGVRKVWFKGAHPAGNVGVQIHHVKPINGGETVWTLDVQAVISIGQLLLGNRFDATRIVALTGDECTENNYVRTAIGANIGDLVQDRLNEGPVRIISGDVLTGTKKELTGFLGFFDDQITAIEEGDYYENFGWLVPTKARPTASSSYFSSIFGDFRYHADTNTHGEKRAFVVTGKYEDVLPMDVYPQQLLKAILVRDLEQMEGLGIYELVEEDVALCEFVCTSKQPIQEILREGLEEMRAQG